MHTLRTMWKIRSNQLNELGISTEHAAVLFIIDSIGAKATTAEIARWLVREPHTVTSLLNTMEKRGLVKRVHDPVRKMLVRIVMTGKGRKVYDQTKNRESIHKANSVLSEKETKQLKSLLEKLWIHALQELGNTYKSPISKF